MLWRWNYTKYVLVHWTLKFVNYFLSTGDEQCDGYWQCADSSDEFYCTDEGLDTFVCTPPWPEAKKSHLRSKWNFLASGQGVGHDIFSTSFDFQCATPRGLIRWVTVGCNYSLFWHFGFSSKFLICYPKGAHSLGHHGGQLPNESNSSKLTDWFIHIRRLITCMVSMGKAMYMGSSQTR